MLVGFANFVANNPSRGSQMATGKHPKVLESRGSKPAECLVDRPPKWMLEIVIGAISFPD